MHVCEWFISKITWFGHCSLHSCWVADNGCGRNNCGSSSLSLRLFTFSPLLLCTLNFFSRIFLPPSPPSRQALLCLGDLYSRSINLKERERDVGTWQFMGDWHGACSDVTRTGGVTLSVVMSTEETPAHAGTDTNAMEGCAIVTFFMRNKHGLSGTLCHACD